MNIMKKIYCRLYQGVYRVAMNFIKIPTPTIIEGAGSSTKVGDILYTHEVHKVLVVTGSHLYASKLIDKMLYSIENKGIVYVVYKDVKANPTIDMVEEALKVYKDNYCEAIVAFGGGSPMDCAKAVGARVACPNKKIPQMKGQLKIKNKLPLLIAIPTTAGTGSEVTLAAVISNSKTHEKYALNDPVLVPSYAVLDPKLIEDLPPEITATTGMDALTHAVEAYIGKSNTLFTKMCAVKAIRLIHGNLVESYNNPHNMTARNNMLKGSYYAGAAFTRAYVGYVHAIAHTLGGFYNVPHGLANAVILPYVLDKYGKSAYKRLAELSDVIKLTDESLTDEAKAKAFIGAIREMNDKMLIQDRFEGIIKQKDIPLMIKRAISEGNPLYPVPKEWGKKEFKEIYDEIR